MTPQQLKDNAYNEAFNAFVARHGSCQLVSKADRLAGLIEGARR